MSVVTLYPDAELLKKIHEVAEHQETTPDEYIGKLVAERVERDHKLAAVALSKKRAEAKKAPKERLAEEQVAAAAKAAAA